MTYGVDQQDEKRPPSDETVAWFRDTAFVLGPFPALSQTFIYREFDAMRELGLDVNIVSTGARLPEAMQVTDSLRALQRSALYLEPQSLRVIGALAAHLRSREVREVLRWMMRFPHRTPAKRARAAAAVLVAAQFAPVLASRGVRYVHSHFAGFQTEIAMSLSRLLDVPYGCTWHAYGIYLDRNILEEKIAGARVVLTCTRHNVEHLHRLRPQDRERIHLAYHGLDLDRIPDPPPIPADDAPVILAIGRLRDGPGRAALESLARELDLRDEVTFLGARPNVEVFQQMASARVIAAPSIVTPEGDMDGLPNVILEAMSMARPVVGSRISGISEVVIPGETGFLSDPGDAEQLAAKLGVLLEDLALAQALGRNARALVVEQFDVRRNVHHVIRHLALSRSV